MSHRAGLCPTCTNEPALCSCRETAEMIAFKSSELSASSSPAQSSSVSSTLSVAAVMSGQEASTIAALRVRVLNAAACRPALRQHSRQRLESPVTRQHQHGGLVGKVPPNRLAEDQICQQALQLVCIRIKTRGVHTGEDVRQAQLRRARHRHQVRAAAGHKGMVKRKDGSR